MVLVARYRWRVVPHNMWSRRLLASSRGHDKDDHWIYLVVGPGRALSREPD